MTEPQFYTWVKDFKYFFIKKGFNDRINPVIFYREHGTKRWYPGIEYKTELKRDIRFKQLIALKIFTDITHVAETICDVAKEYFNETDK